MQKLLWTTLEFPPERGGIAVYIKHICQKLGSEFVVVVTPPTPLKNVFDDTKEPYTIIRTALLWPFIIWPRWTRAVWTIFSTYKKYACSRIVTSHVLPLGYALFVLYKIKKIPYWINLHGMDIRTAATNKWKRVWLKKILTHAEHIIVNSEFTKRQVEALELGIHEKIITVYPCPDDLPKISEEEKNLYANTHGLEGKRVIFSLGRLVQRKGFNRVIAALPLILKSVPSAVYVIAGNGPEFHALEKQIIDAQLQNNVRLVGEIDDHERSILYSLANAFAMPTVEDVRDVEGFGIVYLEAASYGVPSVATMGGGAGEAVLHGVTGIMVENNNPQALAEALIQLLTNTTLTTTLGEQGRARVESEFIWEDQAAKIKTLLL